MSPQSRRYIALCVHYGASAVTERTVNSLFNGRTTPDEVLIIDHATKPLSLPERPEVKIIRPQHNSGYGGGINIGLGSLFVTPPADEDIIIVMNCDAEVDADSLARLKEWWHQQTKLALVGPRAGVVDLLTGRAELEQHPRPQKLGSKGHFKAYVHGAWFAAPWQLFMTVKRVPDHYFLYWEDILLSWQVEELGFELWVIPEIKIRHNEKEDEPVSAERKYYLARNGAITLEREAPTGFRQMWWLYNRLRFLYHHRPGSDQMIRQALKDAVQGTVGKKIQV